jgi:hypothetical protein
VQFAESNPGFLEHLTDRRECEAARLLRAGVTHLQHQPLGDARIKRGCRAHPPIRKFDPSTRKDVFAGHEFVAMMTAAEEHFGAR